MTASNGAALDEISPTTDVEKVTPDQGLSEQNSENDKFNSLAPQTEMERTTVRKNVKIVQSENPPSLPLLGRIRLPFKAVWRASKGYCAQSDTARKCAERGDPY